MKNLLLTAMVSLFALGAQAQIVPSELHSTQEALTVTTNIRSLAHFKAPKLGPPALMQSASVNTIGLNTKFEYNVTDPLALTLSLKKVEDDRRLPFTTAMPLQNRASYLVSYNLKLASELKNRSSGSNRFSYVITRDTAAVAMLTDRKSLMAGE